MARVLAIALGACIFSPQFASGQTTESKEQSSDAPSVGTTTPLPGPAWIPPTIDSDALRVRLENAFRSEPSLANRDIRVTVDAARIGLAGSVRDRQERLTAERIARSFGGNRRIVNNLNTIPAGNEKSGENKSSQGTFTNRRTSQGSSPKPAKSPATGARKPGEQNVTPQ